MQPNSQVISFPSLDYNELSPLYHSPLILSFLASKKTKDPANPSYRQPIQAPRTLDHHLFCQDLVPLLNSLG